MKILLVYKAKEENEKKILNALNDILLMNNHSVVLVSEQEIATTCYEDVTLVMLYNTISNKKKLQSIESKYIPRVLVFEEQKIYQSYITYPNLFNKIILLKDQGTKTIRYLPQKLTEYLQCPFCLNKEIKSWKEDKKIHATVAFISNYANELLVRIAPVLNLFHNFDIKIISHQKVLPKIFNENISVVNWKNHYKTMSESDFIISNGSFALQAIMAEKPVIVVGDNGLGGLITPLVIEKQYNSFFSGRIGGEIRELIPPQLLIDDIITISEMENVEKQLLLCQNKSFLEEQHDQLSKTLNQLLLNIVSNYSEIKNNLFNCQLKLSNDFRLVAVNQNNYIVFYITSNLSHSIIDKEGYEIIHRFKEGNKVSNVMKETGNISEEGEFKEFIIELLNENILTIL